MTRLTARNACKSPVGAVRYAWIADSGLPPGQPGLPYSGHRPNHAAARIGAATTITARRARITGLVTVERLRVSFIPFPSCRFRVWLRVGAIVALEPGRRRPTGDVI